MRPVDSLIRLVVLMYPPEFRSAHGLEVEDGLAEAWRDASPAHAVRHTVSLAGHAIRTRGAWATGERQRETIRQGFVLALVVTLGAAVADADGWRGWPYVFATALLFASAWVLMLRRGRAVSIVAGASLVPTGLEFYDTHAVALPIIGGFSIGIVALTLLLRFTPTSQTPNRYLAAVAGVGLVDLAVGSGYPTTRYLLPALVAVGFLIGLLDARAAVAAALTPLLVAVTRLDQAPFGVSTPLIACVAILASISVIARLRGGRPGGTQTD